MRRTENTAMKRITSVLLSAVMLLSSVQSVFAVTAESFTDFPTGWSRPAMEAAVDNGLLSGFENNEIRPKNNLTRAEMAVIISRAFGAITMADISAYKDVEYGAWYYEYIAKAVQMGAMSGKSTTEMCPDENITREEAFSVVGRILALSDNDTSVLSKFHDAANVSSWAAGNIAALVRRGYVNGDALGYLNPKANITREEFAQFMYITIKRYITQPGTYSGEMQGIVVLRTGNVNLTNLTVNGDLVVGDGAMKLAVNLNNVTVNGRFLTRGGTMTLKNTTVSNGVVVLNPNGITPFNNYSSENVFNGITEITKPSFLPGTTVGSGGGGGSVKTQYNVTFKLNASDTESYARFKVAKGRTIGSNMPANPAKVGYTFEGWFDANGNEVTADTRVTGTLNVTARFLPIQYNIVFRNDDDTPFSYFVDGYLPGNTFNIETTYILPTADKIYRRGYAFAGWADAEGNPVTSVSVTENTPDAGLVLYARWTLNEYELVLDAQFRVGASPRVITYTVENYSSIILPNETEVVIPSGMSSFLGWYKADGTRVTALDESFITEVPGTITLTAKFSPEVATNYDVTFKLNASDTDNYASFSVQGGSTIGSRMPAAPTKLGYTFAGWYANGVEITAATIVNANINAVARWTLNEYELVLDAQFRVGSSPRVITYTVENYRTIALPEEDDLVIPAGMEAFLGWYKADGTRVTALDESFITATVGSITLEARYSPEVVTNYYVTFKLEESDTVIYDRFSVQGGSTIGSRMPAAPTKLGYTFAGWYANGVEITAATIVNANINVVARWTLNEYELVLDAQFRVGSSPRVITYTVENYSSIILPNETEVVIPSGMSSFLGWYKADGTRVTALDESFITATVGSITLEARYSPEVVTNYYVTFKLEESDTVIYDRFSVQGGSTIGSRMPAAPTKLGYTFAGWYANGVEITATTTVNANINAVARWTLNEYELVLDAQFRVGSSPRVITYTVENYRTIVLPGEDDLVIPAGMESFLGWYKADGTRVTALDDSFITDVPGTITLTAKFSEEVIEPTETITVSFYLGYGDYEIYLEERELELNSEGIAQMTESQVPSYPTAGTDVFRKRTYMQTDYPDYNGVYRVTPTLWYEVDGKLIPFNAPVELTRDTKVHLMYQNFALNARVTEMPDAAISSKYNENTRLMDSAKVLGDGAVNWLNLAKMYPKYTEFVDLGIGALVDRDIMDEDRNLKMLYLPIKISQVTTEDVANGMVRTKIRNMISNPAELDELLEMADIDELISYIDKDSVIANLTDEQILTLMQASENRTMVTNYIVSDLQSDDSALMDTVLSYISSSLQTNTQLREKLAIQLKTKLAGNDAAAKNLRKMILQSDSFETLLSNDAIKETVVDMILDTDSGIIDIILDDQELAKKLIEEIADNDDFIDEIVNTNQFKSYVLPLIRKDGEYEDVSTRLINSDTAKRQILDAVEDSDDFKTLLRSPGAVRDEVLNSITVDVDVDGVIKFLFDLEGATDYTYIIGEAKVSEVRAAIEDKIIAAVGGQLVYDMMTPEQKYQARVEAYGNPVVYAEIRTSVTAEINTYIDDNKESILDSFIDGSLTDATLIGMIEDKMIGYVESYINKEATLNASIEAIIEANIINYISDLITGPVPTDPDLADIRARLDEAVDTFIGNAHTNSQLIQVVKDFIDAHNEEPGMISAINDVYNEFIPTIASYITGIDTTSANYAAIDTALKNAANTLDATVLSSFIKDNSTNADILAILEQYIADPDNEDDIIGYVGDFIGTLDASFVHNNRTLIDDMLSALDIEEIIGNDPDRAIQLIKDYIATLDANGKIDLADEIYSQIVVTGEYRSLIEHMFRMDEIVVTPDNMVFVKAISLAIRALSVDEALEFTNNEYIEKLVNLVGEDFITGKFNETRDRYCDGLDEVIETVESGASTRGTYTTSLRFRINPVEDILLKLYNKAQPIAEEKLMNANIYYEDNEYLQYIVKHDVIDRLLIGDGTVNGEFIGYAIKDEVEYAKYVMELLIAADDALCWYGDDANLTEEQVDAIVNAAVTKARIVHAKINGVLEEYMATGDLPAQIEQLLTSVQKINDLFLRVEPKLRTIIDRYLASGINDKIQNGNIEENDKVQTGLDILLGREDPVFTIDCLYDIFYKYDDKVQAKLKQLVDSGKLRRAIDKAFEKVYATDSITNRVDAEKLEKLEEFADQLYAVLVNIANNGIDAYKVNTDGNPTIVDQYHLTIGENEFTMTRSLQ